MKQKSRRGKITRRRKLLTKFAKSYNEQMDDAKTGKTYGSGVALKSSKNSTKKILTATNHNLERTPEYL